jgi:two-component system nitrate/nitrite response regulator NarL
MSKIRVVIVDDHPMFREGVARTLNSDSNIKVVAEGVNSDDAIRLAQKHTPDIILLDISMPGGGIEAANVIATTCPQVKIAMLTVSEREDDVMKSLHAGAHGYILKGVGGQELIEIVSSVHSGDSYVSPRLAARMLSDLKKKPPEEAGSKDLFAELTGREEQILESVSRGLSNKEIGVELNITEKTVKHYMTNVLQKLRVRNRVEAALMLQRKSLMRGEAR